VCELGAFHRVRPAKSVSPITSSLQPSRIRDAALRNNLA
jgi:hypothetical protein